MNRGLIVFACPVCEREYRVMGPMHRYRNQYLSREASVAAVLSGSITFKVKCWECANTMYDNAYLEDGTVPAEG